MRHEEQITVKRRINTYHMYENENEIIGNQLLSKNQENHLQTEEFTTIDEKGLNAVHKEPSPEIVDYDGLVSKSIALNVDDYIKLRLKKPKRKVEVPEETSNDGTIKMVDGKSADLLAWIEKIGEEIFVGEQAGPPTKRDLTIGIKLYREMRDCLNFRILQAMGKGGMNYNNRIVFGVFKIKMLMMWKDGVYIYDEYGNLNIASKLNLISDMKNRETAEYDNDSIQILKRKFDEITQTKPSPNRVAKRNNPC
ncbi:hypothetical protein C2G38_2220554 [Gigaspora rosea]|uniref:Uncharacterized protein n=1 Tax=Gigaspora rosea TaxID=44941 RepID=A0A397UCP4_9GLOM|nr:hypothetical protein C2G38_2220554 [Gigaspora rosea]